MGAVDSSYGDLTPALHANTAWKVELTPLAAK